MKRKDLRSDLIGCSFSILKADWLSPNWCVKQQRRGAFSFMTWTNLRKLVSKWKSTWATSLNHFSCLEMSTTSWTIVFPSSLHPTHHTPWHFLGLDLYVCGKMLHCFMLALWPRTPRGLQAPSFILLRVNCCDRALRGPSLALCPLRSKEAALILSVLLNLPTQEMLIIPSSFCFPVLYAEFNHFYELLQDLITKKSMFVKRLSVYF